MAMDSSPSPWESVSNTLERFASGIKSRSHERLDALYSNALKSPGTIVLLFVVLSAVFAQQGMAFQEQFDDDFEIFLPDGASST